MKHLKFIQLCYNQDSHFLQLIGASFIGCRDLLLQPPEQLMPRASLEILQILTQTLDAKIHLFVKNELIPSSSTEGKNYFSRPLECARLFRTKRETDSILFRLTFALFKIFLHSFKNEKIFDTKPSKT